LATNIGQVRVAVIGQGYVGLTIAMGAAEVGHEVIGIDKSTVLVKALNAGKSHIEGIQNTQLSKVIGQGLYRASIDFSELIDSNIVIFAVPTPLNSIGLPDLSMLEDACDAVAPYLDLNSLVINESTSFVGTLRNVIAKRINKINAQVRKFAISPERVDPGNKYFDIRNTPRIVGGISDDAAEEAIIFYSSFCEDIIRVSSPEVAEATKLLENTFRFVNIGFINEFTKLMNAMGVPVSEVIKSATTKPFGFMPFFPSPGIGGHCIPVDPMYLLKNSMDNNASYEYINISKEINEGMPNYFVERLEEVHGELSGKSILVIGVSYKPNIADTRESSARKILSLLRLRGAKVAWHDPLVGQYMSEESSPVDGNYDLALVLVNHDKIEMDKWRGGPIYCVSNSLRNPSWIPLLA
jgi:UDP-N-acetyl-D-glucosamine dehydrogenase